MKSIQFLALTAAFTLTLAGPAAAQTTTTQDPDKPAITSPSTHAGTMAAGSNSFSMSQAKSHLQENGYSKVTNLKKDKDGVWHATATKDGAKHKVSLDYQGNIKQQ